jgi:hypothetical protein
MFEQVRDHDLLPPGMWDEEGEIILEDEDDTFGRIPEGCCDNCDICALKVCADDAGYPPPLAALPAKLPGLMK